MQVFFWFEILRQRIIVSEMKTFTLATLGILSLFFYSCSLPETTERKPVLPQGSEESDMPWNTPQQGEGGGALGGILGQQGR